MSTSRAARPSTAVSSTASTAAVVWPARARPLTPLWHHACSISTRFIPGWRPTPACMRRQQPATQACHATMKKTWPPVMAGVACRSSGKRWRPNLWLLKCLAIKPIGLIWAKNKFIVFVSFGQSGTINWEWGDCETVIGLLYSKISWQVKCLRL